MKNSKFLIVVLMFFGTSLPQHSFAQGLAGEISSLQSVLDQVYDEMNELSSKLIWVAHRIAGLAALESTASRECRHIAATVPLAFSPLLRPFALGLAILLFPAVLSLMNGILQPIVGATGGMVKDSDKAIAVLLAKKEQAVKNSKSWDMYVGETGSGDREKWYK